MLSVSLDCSSLIVPSVFSDVYVQRINAEMDETIMSNISTVDTVLYTEIQLLLLPINYSPILNSHENYILNINLVISVIL